MSNNLQNDNAHYELRCRECGRRWGNQPRSVCDECFSPLEIAYDYDWIRYVLGEDSIDPLKSIRARISQRPPNMWRYAELLPLPAGFEPRLPVGFTPLFRAPRLAARLAGANDSANAVAAHAARLGLKAWIFIPSDLEPAKILGTQVFGANVVRIAGNYDQVNRLCSQIAEERRWGFVNVNLRPYYAEGSKTVGFEIAEQLGWRLPDNVVVPMAGGSLIT